jgi:hypothetical protein
VSRTREPTRRRQRIPWSSPLSRPRPFHNLADRSPLDGAMVCRMSTCIAQVCHVSVFESPSDSSVRCTSPGNAHTANRA